MDIQPLGDLVPLVVLITAVLSGLVWLIKSQISLQREFRPNGGSTARDTLNEIKADVREIRAKIDDHIEWHVDN